MPPLPVEWVEAPNNEGAKLARIGNIKGWLVNKRLWLYANMPDYDVLSKQLVKWPKMGKKDDYADCLGWCVEVPSGFQTDAPIVVNSAVNWRKKFLINDDAPGDDQYFDNGCGNGLVC